MKQLKHDTHQPSNWHSETNTQTTFVTSIVNGVEISYIETMVIFI